MRALARTATAAVVGGCTLTALGAALLSAPALGAPRNGMPITLDCGSAGTLDAVVVPGSGNWTPALLSGSGARVLVPTGFSDFTFTVLDGEGDVLAEQTDPEGTTKGSTARSPRETVTCAYSDSFPAGEDPDLLAEYPDAETVVFSGVVTAVLAPARR